MKDPFTALIQESEIDPKVWFWIKSIFVSILTIVLIGYLLFEYSKGSCSHYYDYIRQSYNGKVKSKFLNRNDHMNETIRLENGEIHVINPFDKTAYYDSIRIGDHVIKESGSLKYFILKENDTLLFENLEKDCNKFLKNETHTN